MDELDLNTASGLDAPASHVMQDEETQTHLNWMRAALDMAEEAFNAGEVPVGCVFVRDGAIIASARNRTNELRNATRHAELEAIDAILADPLLTPQTPEARIRPLAGTTLYVTVEPCMMCSSALRQAGLKDCFYGCGNERFGGCGSVLGVNAAFVALQYSTSLRADDHARLPHPRHAPYPATGGFLREEAIMALRRFYVTENTNAPVPKSKANRVLKTDILPSKTPLSS